MNNTLYLKTETSIHKSMEQVWDCYTMPQHLVYWNFANDEWHSPRADNSFTIGGTFNIRMESKDGSMGFDFSGTYTNIILHNTIEYTMDDNRTAKINFIQEENAVKVTVQFEPETENTHELQQMGWQMILDNFKKYVEALKA
jgi:uncharacterized protein YndB with AHSA1/START domain